MALTLTKVERAILIKQHEILAAVKPKQRKYHELAARILEDGYFNTWSEEAVGHLSEPLDRDKMKFVHDVWTCTKISSARSKN